MERNFKCSGGEGRGREVKVEGEEVEVMRMEVGWEVRRREPLGEGRWDRGGSSNLTTSNLGLSKSICIAVQSTFHTYTSFPTKTLQTLLPVKTGGVGGVEERKEEARGGGRREVKVKEVEVVWEIRREDIVENYVRSLFVGLSWVQE